MKRLQEPVRQYERRNEARDRSYAASVPADRGYERRYCREDNDVTEVAPVGQNVDEHAEIDAAAEYQTAGERKDVDSRAYRGAAEQRDYQRAESPRHERGKKVADIDRLKPLWQHSRGHSAEKLSENAQSEAREQRQKREGELFRRGFLRVQFRIRIMYVIRIIRSICMMIILGMMQLIYGIRIFFTGELFIIYI